jgi:hypothetical protein
MGFSHHVHNLADPAARNTDLGYGYYQDRTAKDRRLRATASRKPVSGALRGARALAAHALPAPIARKIALTAPAVLGLSCEPFHARSPALSSCYCM